MLVLTRRDQESVMLLVPGLAEPIEVKVVSVNFQTGQVKLGFRAADEVTILRYELYERMERAETPPIQHPGTFCSEHGMVKTCSKCEEAGEAG